MKEESSIIIEKVTYAMTIGDLKFGNVRPGVLEATLKPGKTLEDALDELDERITAWHKKRYPELHKDEGANILTAPEGTKRAYPGPLPTISKESERLEIDIDKCESVGELHELKDRVITTAPPQLIAYYNKRVRELNVERPKDFTDGLE